MSNRPKVAIIDPNTLSMVGLKGMLQTVMPIMTVDCYGSFSELEANQPDQYFHYFVSTDILLSELSFFQERKRKTIVMTTAQTETSQLTGFNSIYINLPEKQLVHSLLQLIQHGHGDARNMPAMVKETVRQDILSRREIEVMSLIVQGYINKEVADKLNIGLSTVVTHRKNIMEKLGLKSVSALTIYAVTHGYVEMEKVKQ
jgi:DNA-binding NarL/FixJ family response regulator